MPQFQPQVPDPLGDTLPGFLSPGRMTAPSVGIDLLVFVREHRLKSAAMQVQLNNITGGECLLGQVCEEEFVDHTCTCDPNGTLLCPGGMGRHDHAAGHAIGSHQNFGAIVEAARHLAFGTLLKLIGGKCSRA